MFGSWCQVVVVVVVVVGVVWSGVGVGGGVDVSVGAVAVAAVVIAVAVSGWNPPIPLILCVASVVRKLISGSLAGVCRFR